jgi:hypothetical protein
MRCICFSSCNLINHCLDFGGYIAQADNHLVIQISLIQLVRIVKKMDLRNRGSSMHLVALYSYDDTQLSVVGVLCCVVSVRQRRGRLGLRDPRGWCAQLQPSHLLPIGFYRICKSSTIVWPL